jgi:hypothetical protein
MKKSTKQSNRIVMPIVMSVIVFLIIVGFAIRSASNTGPTRGKIFDIYDDSMLLTQYAAQIHITCADNKGAVAWDGHYTEVDTNIARADFNRTTRTCIDIVGVQISSPNMVNLRQQKALLLKETWGNAHAQNYLFVRLMSPNTTDTDPTHEFIMIAGKKVPYVAPYKDQVVILGDGLADRALPPDIQQVIGGTGTEQDYLVWDGTDDLPYGTRCELVKAINNERKSGKLGLLTDKRATNIDDLEKLLCANP